MNLTNSISSNSIHTKAHFNELPTIARGAGINFIGTLIGKILAFLFAIFIARMLIPAELGLYYLGLTVTSFLVVLSAFGLDSGVLRFVSLFHGEKDTSRMRGTIISCLSIVIPMSLFIGILLFLSADKIAIYIFHKPNLKNVLKLFSISIPFLAISSIFIMSTQGLKLMQYKMISDIGEAALKFIFVFVLIYCLGLRLSGAVLGNVISAFLAALLAFFFATRLIPIFRGDERPILEFRKLLQFSFPQIFSRFLNFLLVYTDTLMLGYFRTSEEIGIYNIAARVVILGMIIWTAFGTMFAPIIADLHNKGNIDQLGSLFKVVTRWIFTISLPLFLLLILFPKPILNIFGKEFTVGSTCLVILSFGYLLACAIGPANYMVLMTGRSDLNLLNNLVTFIVNVLLNYVLIPKYGVVGAAFATASAITLVNIIRLVQTFYLMRIHPYNLSYLKPLSAGTISILTILFIHNMIPTCPSSISILAFLCCYLFLMYMVKLSREELYVLREMKRKYIHL